MQLLAWLTRHIDSSALDFLDALDSKDLSRVLELLLDQEDRALSSKKIGQVAFWMGRKLSGGPIQDFLRFWLSREKAEENELGLALLGQLARKQAPALFEAAAGLDLGLLQRFHVAALVCPGFPYDRDPDLAALVLRHPDPATRTWAEQFLQQHRERSANQQTHQKHRRDLKLAQRFRNVPGIEEWAEDELRGFETPEGHHEYKFVLPHRKDEALLRGLCAI